MKSIKTKIMALVLSCVVFSTVSVGVFSMLHSRNAVASDSVQIMNLLCENRAEELNALLKRIEQSVETLTLYASYQLDDPGRFKTDADYVDAYAASLLDIALNAGQSTEGALTVYLRFNPEFTSPTSGFFCGRQVRSGMFRELPPTDLSRYDPSDIEHVGWYYVPVSNGKGTWMEPYFNDNIGVEMVSYVVPLYAGGTLMGVVGMDIDFGMLAQVVDYTSVYRTGYTFLTDKDAKIEAHKTLPRGTDLTGYNSGEFREMAEMLRSGGSNGNKLINYTYEGDAKRAAFRTLDNGMRLVLTAPSSEIDEQADQLMVQLLVTILVVALAAATISVVYAVKLVKPLVELTGAARKIAEGDLSVSITHKSNDEVGALAESFRQTVAHLHQYISYINELAYRDPLTGVKNKTAYLENSRRLEEEARIRRVQYAVLVFDINGLKEVNDTRGHDFGDMLIIGACKIICGVFKRSPIYRIGGDEFVALLEGRDYEHYPELLDELQAEFDAYNADGRNDLKISVARGIAIYSEETDLTYSDVFKRADNAMYHNKLEMKRAEK